MTVADLIAFLQKYPQDMPVAYEKYSETCLLELDTIRVEELCEARPDGWVQNKRPDIPSIAYLVFQVTEEKDNGNRAERG